MTGRPVKPIDGLDQHDFDNLTKSPKFSAREKLRLLAMAHVKDGEPFCEVARMIRVGPRIISMWVGKFCKKGLNGLRDQYKGGEKLKIPDDKYEEFRQSVCELQANRTGGRIRGEDIQILMKPKFGIQCSLATVYNTLNRAGLVWITDRSQHPKCSEEAQLAFKKNSKKKLQKLFRAMSN